MSNYNTRVIAPRDRSGDYVDSRSAVRTTERSSSRRIPSLTVSTQYDYNSQDKLGHVTDRNHNYYASQNVDPFTGRPLASSVPGRIPPSTTKQQATTGSIQYPTGYPSDTQGLNPQSATGYGATPEAPYGRSYAKTPIPYPDGTKIQRDYYAYKKLDDTYTAKADEYDDQVRPNASTSNTVGGSMSTKKFTREGHQKMANYAEEASVASITAATARLNFTSDNYGRLPRKGHEGHLKAAANLATSKMPRYARQHNHYAQGGSEREWENKKGDYEIPRPRLTAIVAELDSERRRARAQYESGGGLGGGMILPNGRSEWVSVGGGHRRYWSEEHGDYK